MRLTCLWLLIFIFTASVFTSCQDDIPLLGQEENGAIVPRDSVFIRSITLQSFSPTDPAGNPWDLTSSPFDSSDSAGPDLFYNSYNDRGTADSSDDFTFRQNTHFSNVVDSVLPLSYYFTDPVLVPHFYDSIYLRLYDAEIDTPAIDSTFMDSILFVIGPDNSQANPYILTIDGFGFNGSQVTLGLEWK